MRKGAGRDLVRRLTPCHTTGSVSRTANKQHIQQHVQQTSSNTSSNKWGRDHEHHPALGTHHSGTAAAGA
jgi:hypothetical protein